MLTMSQNPSLTPPTEVSSKPKRRTFTAEYKRGILRELDGCSKHGEIGALLRREGLHSSLVSEWKLARERGDLAGATKPRGPKPKQIDARDARIVELEREVLTLQKRAKRAETLVALQKKVAVLLGNPLVDPDDVL